VKPLRNYDVTFRIDSDPEPRIQNFKGRAPADAYAKCLRRYPGAQLLGAVLEGELVGGNWSSITYPPVSTVGIKPEPGSKPKEEQARFPFWDGCLGKGRLTELTP
jgi:hypothetical protein